MFFNCYQNPKPAFKRYFLQHGRMSRVLCGRDCWCGSYPRLISHHHMFAITQADGAPVATATDTNKSQRNPIHTRKFCPTKCYLCEFKADLDTSCTSCQKQRISSFTLVWKFTYKFWKNFHRFITDFLIFIFIIKMIVVLSF